MRQKTVRIPPESGTGEWKQSLGEWKEIVETCAAFATAKGGRIWIGVKNDGSVKGVQIDKGSIEDLANKIAQNTNPRRTAKRERVSLIQRGLIRRWGGGHHVWYEVSDLLASQDGKQMASNGKQ